MGKNKSRRRGGDPAFPRLLGERLCLDYANTVEGPRSTLSMAQAILAF